MNSLEVYQEKQGVDLFVGRTFTNLCPIAAMLAYLALRGQIEGPLFMWDGRSLSRESLVLWLRATLSKAGINLSLFSDHSFRIGAASTAAARGISEVTVQTLGRWNSNAS